MFKQDACHAWREVRWAGLLGRLGGGWFLEKIVRALPSGMSAISSPSQWPRMLGRSSLWPCCSRWPTICAGAARAAEPQGLRGVCAPRVRCCACLHVSWQHIIIF